jgi:hypothetical protein
MTLTHIRSSTEPQDGLSFLGLHRIKQDRPRRFAAILDERFNRRGELDSLFELRERNLHLPCNALGEQSRSSMFCQAGPLVWFQVAVSNGEFPAFEEMSPEEVRTLQFWRGAFPAWLCDELDRDRV